MHITEDVLLHEVSQFFNFEHIYHLRHVNKHYLNVYQQKLLSFVGDTPANKHGDHLYPLAISNDDIFLFAWLLDKVYLSVNLLDLLVEFFPPKIFMFVLNNRNPVLHRWKQSSLGDNFLVKVRRGDFYASSMYHFLIAAISTYADNHGEILKQKLSACPMINRLLYQCLDRDNMHFEKYALLSNMLDPTLTLTNRRLGKYNHWLASLKMPA